MAGSILLPTMSKSQFASDNYAGICPEAWEALQAANVGHAHAYGADPWTQEASDKIREVFNKDCEVFFVFNGTAANSLVISHLCESYHSVISHELAHLETDECGGPEFFSNGTKLLTVPGDNGKLDLGAVEKKITKRSDIHYPKPRVLSITQATEAGTLYSLRELKAIHKLAQKYKLKLHMDGARFANALATLNCHPSEISWKVGVDVLCLGGTKNGMAIGEAVIFFNRKLAAEFDYRCKQAGQLASKLRFIAAPWIGMLRDAVWLKYAKQANGAAILLESSLQGIPDIEIMYPCQANAVFVKMPEATAKALREKGWQFYNFIGTGGNRFMCSWDTTHEDVDNLVEDIKSLIWKT